MAVAAGGGGSWQMVAGGTGQTPSLQTQRRQMSVAGTAQAAVFVPAAELATRMVMSDPRPAHSLSLPPRLEDTAR